MQLSVEEAKALFGEIDAAQEILETNGNLAREVEHLRTSLTAANAEIERLKELNRDLLLADSPSSPLPAGVELKPGSVVFVPTGEKRNPKTGEWFLNRTGAFVLADHDWGVGSTFAIYTRYDIPAQTEKEVQS